MHYHLKFFVALPFWLITLLTNAQTGQQFANIGDLTTTRGEVIKNCKVGYRTMGKLNEDKSNVILWTTWFTGTSEQVAGALVSSMDTTGRYVIVVDALTNGVSSSPSNTTDLPQVSIRDMVNSQYTLLTEHLEIDHVYAVMGISMGGMQTFEWLVAYPDFMDKAIPIIGTPKQSFYDNLVWQTQADLIAEADPSNLEWAYQRAQNITQMNLYSPTFMATQFSPDSLENYLETQYAGQMMKPEDYLGGLNAMIPHDILKSAGLNADEIGEATKAAVLVIVSEEDHLVNPLSSIDLAKKLGWKLITLVTPCGHMAPFCEAAKVREATTSFLE